MMTPYEKVEIIKDCLSTHGAAGYAPGSYWNGEVIVCSCGFRIENPHAFNNDANGNPKFPNWIGRKS